MSQQNPGPINGLNPGLYAGSLPNMVIMHRPPTSQDKAGYLLGHWWVVPVNATYPTGEIWVLVSLLYGVATWKRLYATNPITSPVSVNKIYLTTPGAGTYTPTNGMIQCFVECAAGGGSGSTQNTFLGGFAVNAPGGGGGYCYKLYTKNDIVGSKPYVVGAGGIASRVGGDHVGLDGGNTTFGTVATAVYLEALGGQGGQLASTPAAFENSNMGGAGGAATGGDINMNGGKAIFTYVDGAGSPAPVAGGGLGGRSFYGLGPTSVRPDQDTGFDGDNGSGGGDGATPWPSQLYGGNGGNGLIIITEYIS